MIGTLFNNFLFNLSIYMLLICLFGFFKNVESVICYYYPSYPNTIIKISTTCTVRCCGGYQTSSLNTCCSSYSNSNSYSTSSDAPWWVVFPIIFVIVMALVVFMIVFNIIKRNKLKNRFSKVRPNHTNPPSVIITPNPSYPRNFVKKPDLPPSYEDLIRNNQPTSIQLQNEFDMPMPALPASHLAKNNLKY